MRSTGICVLLLALSSAAEATTYKEAVLGTPGLVSYWRLGDASGSVAVDMLGSNAGTYVGAPLLSQTGALVDPPDLAVVFNGASQYVAANAALFGAPSSVTIETWAKVLSTKPAGGIHFLLTDSLDDFNDGFMMGVDDLNVPFAVFVDALGEQASPLATTTMALGSWYHVVATFEGSSNQASLYVNGRLEATSGIDAGIAYVPDGGLLFASQEKPFAQSSRFLGGALCEVALYDRALTAAEVAAHFESGGIGAPNNFRVGCDCQSTSLTYLLSATGLLSFSLLRRRRARFSSISDRSAKLR